MSTFHNPSLFKDYPKLSQTYYVLLECLAQDHMAFLATLEPQVCQLERNHGIISLIKNLFCSRSFCIFSRPYQKGYKL